MDHHGDPQIDPQDGHQVHKPTPFVRRYCGVVKPTNTIQHRVENLQVHVRILQFIDPDV